MIQISNKVFYIGTNDRKKHLFENNWPLPNGVAYNSYIIADEHPALIGTGSGIYDRQPHGARSLQHDR